MLIGASYPMASIIPLSLIYLFISSLQVPPQPEASADNETPTEIPETPPEALVDPVRLDDSLDDSLDGPQLLDHDMLRKMQRVIIPSVDPQPAVRDGPRPCHNVSDQDVVMAGHPSLAHAYDVTCGAVYFPDPCPCSCSFSLFLFFFLSRCCCFLFSRVQSPRAVSAALAWCCSDRTRIAAAIAIVRNTPVSKPPSLLLVSCWSLVGLRLFLYVAHVRR